MCTITQADLGSAFADVASEDADAAILGATEFVLGPTADQVTALAAWSRCRLDPCRAILLLAKHMLAVSPNSGATEAGAVASESIGGVSVSYSLGSADSTSGVFAGSLHGRLFAALLGKFEVCSARRRSFPIGVGPSSAS